MKSYTIVHILLFILAVLVYQCAQAQDYVISLKGDSIAGEVKPMTFGPEKKVQVVSSDKKKNTYSVFQVRRFSYKGELYHPVKFEKGYTFMKLLKPGYLSLYAFQMENQVTYDGMFLLKKDGSGLEIPNLSFKKFVTKFLEDCPVSKKVSSGEFGKKDLHNIVSEYNECIDERTIDHGKILVHKQDQVRKISAWDSLEEKVKSKSEFQGKSDALEMITDIKGKINRDEKVPNFLLDGLKNALASAELSSELNDALNDLSKN